MADKDLKNQDASQPRILSYDDLKLASCAQATIAKKGPEKGVLIFDQSSASIGALNPDQLDIPHVTFESDNGYAAVSARIGPPLNNKPTGLDINAHIGGSIATVSAPDVANLRKLSVSSSGPGGATAQRMATEVINEIKTCMASPATPVVSKPFKIVQPFKVMP